MIRKMPDYGGEWLPGDHKVEAREMKEQHDWGERMTLALRLKMEESKNAMFFAPDGEELYHIQITLDHADAGNDKVRFNIFNMKGNKSYAINHLGDITPSVIEGHHFVDEQPTMSEIETDIGNIIRLSKRHLG